MFDTYEELRALCTPDTALVVEQMFAEAQLTRQQQVGSEHILLGLAVEGWTAFLGSTTLDAQQVRQEIDRIMGISEQRRPEFSEMGLTRAAKEVFGSALAAAWTEGRGTINCVDLHCALVRQRCSMAKHIMGQGFGLQSAA